MADAGDSAVGKDFWKLYARLGEAHRHAIAELTSSQSKLGEATTGSGEPRRDQDSDDDSIAELHQSERQDQQEGVGSGGFSRPSGSLLLRSGSKLSIGGTQLSVPVGPQSPPSTSPINGSKRRSATVDSVMGKSRQRCMSSASFLSGMNPDYVALGEVGDLSQMVMGAGDNKARETAAKLQEALAALQPKDYKDLFDRHAIPHEKQKLPSLDDDDDEDGEHCFCPRAEWSAAGGGDRSSSKTRASMRKPAVTVNSHMGTDEISLQNRRSTSRLSSLSDLLPQLVFMPTGFFRTTWDFINILILTVELILLPLHVFDAMVPTPFLIGLSWIIQIFWNLDIIVHFRTCFYMRGYAVKDARKIAQRYLRGWFLCDFSNVLADLYLDSRASYAVAVLSEADFTSDLYYVVIIKFLLRLVRFAKLNGIAQSLIRRLNSDTAIAKAKIFLLSCQILLMQHVMACIWYKVGVVSNEGWVSQFEFSEKNMDYRYTTALHWMFCQLGFGSTGIEGSTTLERVFGLIVAFLALVVFSTLLGAITSLTNQLNKASEERKHQFRQLRKYLNQHHINEDLSLRITGFLQDAYSLRQARLADSQVALLELLSKPLRGELQYAMYERCLEEMTFVKDELLRYDDRGNLQAAKNLATEALTQRTFAPADTVFEAEVIANHAYFMTSGMLVYELSGYKVHLNGAPEEPQWLVEMSLWIPWLHLGELTTEDVSGLVLLEVEKFAASIRRSFNGHSLARDFAQKVVNRMNEMEVVTDLWQMPPKEDPEEEHHRRASLDHNSFLQHLPFRRFISTEADFSKVIP
ncbi:Kcnh1, partial [Symbiodinium sp. KB8]